MKKQIGICILVLAIFILQGCQGIRNRDDEPKTGKNDTTQETNTTEEKTQKKEWEAGVPVHIENEKVIYLAGGCFWGVEGYLKQLKGVLSTTTGYANGKTEDTTYEDIKATDHAETVKVVYDKSIISLEEILLHFFRIIDPLSINQQGNDKGRQYRTGVYYVDTRDLDAIDRIFAHETEIHGELAVEKEALTNFINAEDYHQDYLDKNPNGYCHINLYQAKEPLFTEKYPLPDEETLKNILGDESYKVLRESDTEAPFSSPLEKEYRKGIYVDKATGEPLFASQDKFDSGCGWPSFSKPILTDKIEYVEDKSHGMNRVEVRSKGGHLGHVFTDGPKEKGGLRYCINGAALEFIPYEEMEERGYGAYKPLCE